ncbi:MAG: C_GCAxxG_C_C family protein [Spirochaetales bacterium]|nr:C_GCAxxG_C_C family protein [Spirochaetales bacterium]
MNETNWELLELAGKGYCCSQILAAQALSIKGVENPLLIRTMKAFCGGLQSGLLCGALSGGACFLELLHEGSAFVMIPELISWFTDNFGSSDCGVLTGGDADWKAEHCPLIIAGVYEKCLELLENHDYEIE